jgi:hypothetical protein
MGDGQDHGGDGEHCRADQNQAVTTVHMTTVDTRLLYSNNCMKAFFGSAMHMMLLEEEVNCLAMLVPERTSHIAGRETF